MQDQAPEHNGLLRANKRKTATQKGEKKNQEIQTLEKTLIYVLDNSHVIGVFAFPSNIVWI